jgi:L-arabinose transport system ATP-binding protein
MQVHPLPRTAEVPPAPLLLLEGIWKRFGVVQALSNVTLTLGVGEVLALVGENGAGKSTLLRILEGVYPPDQGRIVIAGQRQEFRSPAQAHAAGIRVIHQEPDIAPDLPVAENLFIGDLKAVGGIFLDRRDLARRTLALLRRFGLEQDLSPWIRAGNLGPAHRQLLEIMRALRADVRILALDEPTSSLTEEEARRLFAVVRHLKSEGVGIIYISHRMHEVRELADSIAVLRDGCLITQQPTSEIDDAAVLQLMVGRPIANLFEGSPRAPGAVLLSVEHLSTDKVTDISFQVRAGEVVGLAGLVGAGRSELAQAIFGVDPLTAGSISVAGKRVRLRSPADAIAAGIGFAPEDRKGQGLLLLASVQDNVVLAVPHRIGRLGFLRPGAGRHVAAEQVRGLRIKTPGLGQLVSKLSGGNQQKVVLGRWLARQPRVLILDEPTRGIDVGAKAEIYRLIARLAAQGMALLVISSEMPELLGLCDRILVMAAGRLVADLDRAEASEQRILDLAMSGHRRSLAPEEERA